MPVISQKTASAGVAEERREREGKGGRTYLASCVKLDPFMFFCVFLSIYYRVVMCMLASEPLPIVMAWHRLNRTYLLGDVELNGLVLWRMALDVFGRRAKSLAVGANEEGRAARRVRERRVVCVAMACDLDSVCDKGLLMLSLMTSHWLRVYYRSKSSGVASCLAR